MKLPSVTLLENNDKQEQSISQQQHHISLSLKEAVVVCKIVLRQSQ